MNWRHFSLSRCRGSLALQSVAQAFFRGDECCCIFVFYASTDCYNTNQINIFKFKKLLVGHCKISATIIQEFYRGPRLPLFFRCYASSACKFRNITLTNIAHVTGLFSYSHLFYVFSCHVQAPSIVCHLSFSHIYNDDDIQHENLALYLFPNSQPRKKLKNLG